MSDGLGSRASDAEAAINLIEVIWKIRAELEKHHGPPSPFGLGLPPWREGDTELYWDELDELTVRVAGAAERSGLDSTILHTLTRTRDPLYLDSAEDFTMRVFSVLRTTEPSPRSMRRSANATEQAVLQVLQNDGFVGAETLGDLPKAKRPTGAYLAKRAIGRNADGQFKATLSHMVDLEWIGNGQHERAGPGYFLRPKGVEVLRCNRQSGPSPD